MTASQVIDLATLIGTALSVVGVGIALWQLARTRKAAAAAEEAAQQARGAISSNVLLVDAAACIRNLEEVKAYVRNNRLEAALLRLTDTRSQLVQIRSMTSESTSAQSIQHVVAQLGLLRDVLEETQQGRSDGLDRIEAIRSLDDASDILTGWLAPAKYLTD